eukprot:338953-Pleurochrysis_carterae.AAC.3
MDECDEVEKTESLLSEKLSRLIDVLASCQALRLLFEGPGEDGHIVTAQKKTLHSMQAPCRTSKLPKRQCARLRLSSAAAAYAYPTRTVVRASHSHRIGAPP